MHHHTAFQRIVLAYIPVWVWSVVQAVRWHRRPGPVRGRSRPRRRTGPR